MKRFSQNIFRPLLPLLILTATPASVSAIESVYSRLHRLARHIEAPKGLKEARVKKMLREFPRRVYPTMDITREVTGVEMVQQGSADMIPFTGKGVTIAVIDAGIDPTHIAFSREGEGSRVVRYLRTASAAETDSEELEIREFSDIDSLTADDIDTTTESHGTHTAGIAGGTVNVSPYSGIAPEADLYLVSMGWQLYDDEIAAGMHSALKYADEAGTPLVMNFSLGSAVGSHRGDNPLTESLKDYPAEGRIAVFAAGNDGVNGLSITRNFAEEPGELATGIARVFTGTGAPTFYTEVYSEDETEFEIGFAVLRISDKREEVWRSRYLTPADFDDSGTCIVLNPETQSCLLPGLEKYFNGILALALEADENLPFSMGIYGDFNNVTLESPYALVMLLRSPQGASIMAVTDFSFATFKSYTMEGYESGNPDNSISDYCTSPRVVSVGSWNARESWTDISGEEHKLNYPFFGPLNAPGFYSSYGTVRGTDIRLPHMLAPGTDVISAMQSIHLDTNAAYVTEIGGREYKWGAQTGTSMATPAVAGIIALWLEACPTLTRDDIIQIVAETAAHDDTTLSAPQGSAYGKVNAYDGLRYILTNLSVPGAVTPEPHGRLMVRNFGGGLIECAVPFSCTEGIATVYSAQGAMIASTPLTNGAARFSLSSGVHIIKVVTPQGCASEKVIIPSYR